MPFETIYRVNFANARVIPDIDVFHWGPVQFMSEPDCLFEINNPDDKGIHISLTHPKGTTGKRGSVFVPIPQGFRLETRLRVQIEFDSTKSEVYRRDDTLVPSPPWSDLPYPADLTMTEAWVIGVGPSKTANLMTDNDFSVVTCQFVRDFGGGIRLNTPGPLQKDPEDPAGKPDKAAPFVTPFSYEEIYGMVFTLDHFFCGYPGVMNCTSTSLVSHTTGFGVLKMSDPDGFLQAEDYRACSSKTFYSADVGSPIKSLGAIITNLGGMGRMSVRIRRFTVWENRPPLHP